ncbi:MAG: CHASE3 domain-containing protein [Ferruginibacter sp.]
MKISFQQKLLIFSFTILACNGLIGFGVYNSNQRLLDAEKGVQQTEQVIYQSGHIFSLAKDIESASRGFVITEDTTYLKPLYAAEKTTFAYIRQLRQLTQDNPVQQQRVDSLRFYIQMRMDFSNQTVMLRINQGLASAIAYISTNQGRQNSDRLRQIINDIQREEDHLLKQREQTNERSLAAFNRFSVFLIILMAVFTILLLLVTGNYLLQNKEKEKRAAELIIANKELVFQNEEKEKRAEALIIADRELVFQSEEKEKRAAELIIANEELVFQNEEKEKRAEELSIVNKDLESFSYSVSHDLRAPLRAINGYAQILKEDSGTQLDNESIRVINNIMDNAKKMGQLLDDLLTFSRIGRKELVKVNIPMHDMVTNLCNEIKNEHNNRTIHFKINDLQPAEGDSATLKQVWINLISNAVKYSRQNENAVIEIGSAIKDDEIIYHIKDNGAGFDMRYADKLFGVFQRLHSDKEFEGNGVGLAIVHRIISKHGGRVWAEAKVNEGAIFHFSLPKNISS